MTNYRMIAFSGIMLDAAVAGIKTQTRRKVRGWPSDVYAVSDPRGEGSRFTFAERDYRCQYGDVGTVLALKEPWAVGPECDGMMPSQIPPYDIATGGPRKVWYSGLGFGVVGKPRNARFMPYWMARRFFVVERVRYEPLCWIMPEDAIAEGLECVGVDSRGAKLWRGCPGGWPCASPKLAFYDLWDSIHGKDAWAIPTMVWAITFRSVTYGSKEWEMYRDELFEGKKREGK